MTRCDWCGAPEDRRQGREACRYCDTVYQNHSPSKLEQVMQLQQAGVISREYAVRWLVPANCTFDGDLNNDIGTIIRYGAGYALGYNIAGSF